MVIAWITRGYHDVSVLFELWAIQHSCAFLDMAQLSRRRMTQSLQQQLASDQTNHESTQGVLINSYSHKLFYHCLGKIWCSNTSIARRDFRSGITPPGSLSGCPRSPGPRSPWADHPPSIGHPKLMVPRKVDLFLRGFAHFINNFRESQGKHTGWGPSSLAKLVNIIIITIVYDTYNILQLYLDGVINQLITKDTTVLEARHDGRTWENMVNSII